MHNAIWNNSFCSSSCISIPSTTIFAAMANVSSLELHFVCRMRNYESNMKIWMHEPRNTCILQSRVDISRNHIRISHTHNKVSNNFTTVEKFEREWKITFFSFLQKMPTTWMKMLNLDECCPIMAIWIIFLLETEQHGRLLLVSICRKWILWYFLTWALLDSWIVWIRV